MLLVIIHHHFRPGGVRRVIELATPQVVAHAPAPLREIVLATGEAPEATWLDRLRQSLPGLLVRVLVIPAFGYASEQELHGRDLRKAVTEGIRKLREEIRGRACLIWAHNLSLGRNFYLTRELACTCHRAGIRLLLHHHDWWLENRWQHFTAMRHTGFARLGATAEALFRRSPHIFHAAINQADATVLQKYLPGRAVWLPNPAAPEPPPPPARVRAAHAWLRRRLGTDAPVWLLPARLLRRKNIAEALLLTRWLRPEAWLVTTGGPSSAEEQPYAAVLTAAAQTHGWQVRLGILHGSDRQAPTVKELMAASEALLLTSLQEGFGLPFVEAAAARRPLLARALPNIAPDLAQFGFRFPQLYQEIMVDPALFRWQAEQERQTRWFTEWLHLLPKAAARLAQKPALLAGGTAPHPVAFSRLTLTAQLEVLAQPVACSWERCAALNPCLRRWRARAARQALGISPWPRSAAQWLSGPAYGRRFAESFGQIPARSLRPGAGLWAQAALLRQKLQTESLYPLLWKTET